MFICRRHQRGRFRRDARRTRRRLGGAGLLLPSIQVNIRAGKFPPAHVNGVRYLTIPVKFKNAKRGSYSNGATNLSLCFTDATRTYGEGPQAEELPDLAR